MAIEDIEETFFHLLALVIDETGNGGWQWLNVAFGSGTYLRHYGHLIPSPYPSLQPSLAAVTIENIDSKEGFVFSAVEIVDSLEAQDSFSCFDDSQPFLLDWALGGRCGLDELRGKRLVVELW